MKYKLANILMDHDERFFAYQRLYCFAHNAIVKDEASGGSTLLAYSTFDFGTYFNSFSNKKWRKYTTIDNVHFSMEVKGKADIIFWSACMQPVGLGKTRLGSVSVDSSEFETVEFEFPQNNDDILAFQIVTLSTTVIRNGCYYSNVEESQLRNVHLGLVTTTFKKEEYIRNNVALLKGDIKACNDPVSSHVSMIIVDNGRTLDPSELEGDGVFVFPNKNVGGSGGFARGMIEAKRLNADDPITHVLIMDDDISLSSESIKRTYNVLALANAEYAEAFVSGAMFSLGDQVVQVEDVGYTSRRGKFGPVKPRRRMDNFYEIVANEGELPIRQNKYAAFWYCCIPMSTIEKNGLPLPLFIRYDDAEYGQRCNPKFITMNGINVWHMDFTDRYNPFYERYCGMRNSLVIQATSGVCSRVNFFKTLFSEPFVREIKKFNYGEAELLLDALEDYLRGPEFLAVEQCERQLKEKMAKCNKFTPLEELDIGNISLESLTTKKKLSKRESKKDRKTYNGQRLIPGRFANKGSVAIAFRPDSYPAPMVHFHKKILVVNRLGTEGYFLRRDRKRFRELFRRYKSLVKKYEEIHDEVEKRYAQAGSYLKSEEFWFEYLEIEKYGRERLVD